MKKTVGEVVGLYTYPLKSGAAVSHEALEIDMKGPRHDRLLMAVDPATMKAVTQRETPALALVSAHTDDAGITLGAQNAQPLRAAWTELGQGQVVSALLHGENVAARFAPQPVSDWLSAAIGREVKVVYQPPDFDRPTDARYVPGGNVSLADGYPLLFTLTASLDDLNGKITAKGGDAVPMDRFRTTVVVKSRRAWIEDKIATASVGGMQFDFIKACGRCVMTTVDQSTGVKAGKEPTATLASFRLVADPVSGKNEVLFGVNAMPHSPGVILLGDEVTILKTQPPPQFKNKPAKG